MRKIIPQLTETQIRDFAAYAASISLDGVEQFDPLKSDGDSARVVQVLNMKVRHANATAVAEVGSFHDMSAPYASYAAPYAEYGNDAKVAERRAVAHTAARIGEEMLARSSD